jgi:hypothetical protein
MIRPRLSKVASGTTLTTDLVNDIINRTEYAADLLRQYKLIAGTEMYVEPHYGGTRVSYYYPVAGGATPADLVLPPPVNDGSTPGRAATYADLLRIYGKPDGVIDISSATLGRIYTDFSGFVGTNDVVIADNDLFAPQFPTGGNPSAAPGFWTNYEYLTYPQIYVFYGGLPSNVSSILRSN